MSAVEAAREAAGTWQRTTPAQRAQVLHAAADLVSASAEQLAQSIAGSVGKPITEARGEAGRTSAVLRHAAGLTLRPSGRLWASDDPATTVIAARAPLGTVALITPFNFPTAIPAWKLGPALAAGNTVVWKPSELACESAELLHALLLQAGVPADVVQLVEGGPSAGAALVTEVDGVSFTGSSGVGRQIAVACAGTGIPVQLELGGKNTAVVLADADLPAAARDIAAAAFGFAGQKCTATSRVLVSKEVATPFLDELSAAVQRLAVGDPRKPSTVCGPVASVSEQDGLVAPRVVRDVPVEHPVWATELFGPVLAVREVADHTEAFALVDAAADSLAAGLHTRSSAVVQEAVRSLRAGVVAVNRPTTGLDPHVPFGGTGRTATGPREQGPDAMEFYSQERTVYWREATA